ncbi:Uncharacterised protein r2_g976 [Pycnogonum litorale]
MSVKSIKYICKYINKGSDMAVFEVQRADAPRDEVKQFQMGRYISSNEAIWRILQFPIHERSPAVHQLSVHLENGQRVYFTPDTAHQRAAAPSATTLTAFFSLCRSNNFAKTLLYPEVPSYFTWNATKKEWKARCQGKVTQVSVPGFEGPIQKSTMIGRMYTVHPNHQECFFLRTLLHTVRGPTSFESLRTVNGTVCTTYREACFRLGLLEDDRHWDLALQEASLSRMPRQMRDLFSVMLQSCHISNPIELWETYKENLSEDFLYQAQRRHSAAQYTNSIFNLTLIAIEDKVLSLGGKGLKMLGLPTPERDNQHAISNDMVRETSYDRVELTHFVHEHERMLIPDQQQAYQTLLHAIEAKKGGLFFLDAPGGTGKTFLTNLLLAKIRAKGEIALAVASSGIAATLLAGGRTAHSTFKLPLDMLRHEAPVCNISKGTAMAQVLLEARIIVWDECTMSHKHAFEAVDRTLCDLCNNSSVMGGKLFLLTGDFRQTLPIVPKGTKADELAASIKSSHLWQHVQKLTLQTNMRAHLTGDVKASDFAKNLLNIGNGTLGNNVDGTINVPSHVAMPSAEALQETVFPNLTYNFKSARWLRERAILAPRNDDVDSINNDLLKKIPGQQQHYKSIDTMVNPDEVTEYPNEFLNSLQPSGVPPHNLSLNIGTPIMLLRNLDPPKLCNGTRLIVTKLQPHLIEAIILTGASQGEMVFIPRIPIIPSDLPFQFKRLQYPVKVSFAMTINKSQGQSLRTVGLNLKTSCFGHGQFYVGCSRVGAECNLHIFTPDKKTKNVVYQEALL